MTSTLIFTSLAVLGLLFLLKMVYVLCTSMVLPKTGGALYVSTTRKRIDAIVAEVSMQPDQIFVDMGCGDGRVLRAVRKRHGAKVRGYELNPMAYLKARILSFGKKGICITRKNFLTADLSKADVVFCYLFPDVMENLKAKLRLELKPGAVFISCNFPLPGVSAEKMLRPEGSLHSDPIYIYNSNAITGC